MTNLLLACSVASLAVIAAIAAAQVQFSATRVGEVPSIQKRTVAAAPWCSIDMDERLKCHRPSADVFNGNHWALHSCYRKGLAARRSGHLEPTSFRMAALS